MGGLERIQLVVGKSLAPALKSAGFRRVGASFVRKLPDGPLSHIVQITPSATRAGTFTLHVAIGSAPLYLLWTGKRDRNPAGSWLESWRADEITGETRHREFHSEDPDVVHDLSRASEKIAAALRREPYRNVVAILKRTKTPMKQAALLHFLGRTSEAENVLERELGRDLDPNARDSVTALKARFSEAPH